MPGWPRDVLILTEASQGGGDFGASFSAGFRHHGCRVSLQSREEEWTGRFDLVLAYGPFSAAGSMLPTGRRLLSCEPRRRPLFAWWLTEGLPRHAVPTSIVRLGASIRVGLDAWARRRAAGPRREPRWWSRGHRFRIVGELLWFRRHGLLDVLAVTSGSRGAYLGRFNLDFLHVPLGYDPESYGRDLKMTRDIDVCFLGQTGGRRRSRLLGRTMSELRRLGIDTVVHSNLYGDDRCRFLNRCKVMLNVLRGRHDFVGQRLLLGAANKTLVVSEPMVDLEPFRPNRLFAVAPVEKLAETVKYYLDHEEQRREMVERAHRFVNQDLTVSQMVGRILKSARIVRKRPQAVPDGKGIFQE